MKNNRTLSTLILFMAALPALPAQPLEQVVREALTSNPDVQVAVQQFRTAGYDKDLARGNFMPTLNLRGDYGDEHIEKERLATTDKTRSSLTAEATVPLFRGFGNMSQFDRSKYLLQSTYHRTMAVAESTALAIARAYLNVLKSREILALSENNLDAHEKTLGLIQEMVNQGATDEANLYQIQGRVSRAKASLTDAQNNLLDAQTVYKQLVGVPPTSLTSPVPSEGYIPGSRSEVVLNAQKNHNSLLSAELNIDAAREGVRTRSARFYPQVDLVAERTWKDDYQGFAGEEDETRVLLRANLNLFDGGKKFAERNRALSQMNETERVRDRIERQVMANVGASWDAYTSLQAKLDYLGEYVRAASETLRLYEVQFNVGKRSLLDLLDSRNEFFNAEQVYISTKYDYLASQYRVIESMNSLLPSMNIDIMEGLLEE